ILQTLDLVESNIPVVWNSNFYMSDEAMGILKGIVDIYLSDFKYGNNECGSRLSKVNNYFDIISENHKKAFDDAELVIRHLVLPSHFECCGRPILEFVHDNFKDKAVVNIMGQYRPCYNAKEYPEIARSVSSDEMSQAINLAEKLNLNYIT
ncbi:MAG: radical SAM protein, partial [Candidatus Heimdallarchaeota archaeon]|nr:radical SAM protein [Candidatus Heimdallarchaeota archaeon]